MDLSRVFSILRTQRRISYSGLVDCGVPDSLIENFLETGIFTADDNEEYTVGSIDDLVYYGRELLTNKDFKTANEIFICAYSIDHNNFNANYQLFYRNLLKAKEQYIFKHFNIVYDYMKKNGNYADANYYLYLLGNLYDLPKEYQDSFDNIKIDDILLEEKDDEAKTLNVFRKNVYANSYFKVNGMLDERLGNIPSEEISFEDKVEKEFILKWLFKSRLLHKNSYVLLKQENYEELKKVLEEEDKHRFLSMSDQYLLKLINQYLLIKNNDEVFEVKGEGYNTFDAIDNNNFEQALNLLREHQEDHSIEKDSYLQIMLERIICLINNKKSNIQPLIDAVSEMRKKYDTKEEISVGLSDKEKQSLMSKIDELRAGRSAFLLEPMPKTKRDMIQKIASKFNDIAAFSIGQEPERRLVLRYHPFIKEQVDKLDVVKEAKSLYHKGKYEEAAKQYELLLKLGRPRDITYGMYGLTLLRLHKRNEALDYLKIATILSKESGGNLDYSDLIYEIENPDDRNNLKPRVEVKEEEFSDNNKVTLDDKLLNDLIGLTQEGEISLLDACSKLGFSEVDTNYVKLLYARDCYYLGDMSKGDTYLKQVEKSKAKDQRVKDLYKEILLDKKYYSKRLDTEKDNQLIFIKRK